MKILVIGGGGREHSLSWILAQSAEVSQVFCTPGSDGIGQDAKLVAPQGRAPKEYAELATSIGADLTVVGPEAPLMAGIADEFGERGLALLGPARAGAELEGSKAFAKRFMGRHGIPTAGFKVCEDNAAAYTALCAVEWPCVIKADGLAAGKGVRLVHDPDEATATVDEFMVDRIFGDAGGRIVIEECLEGDEISFIVLTDGETVLPFPPSQDHKRAFDGDEGPNTGGMGAYSDDGLVSDALQERILKEIVGPTIKGLKQDGIPYRGFLYFGLMLTTEGPKVLEYNCRMGDPECQSLMMRCKGNLAEALMKCATGNLAAADLAFSPDSTACVVLTSGGYPGKYETGKPISGLDEAQQVEGVKVFHAGTRREGDSFVTAGGRVLGVTARGADLQTALRRCYEAAGKIEFEGRHYRTDIGARGLRATQATG